MKYILLAMACAVSLELSALEYKVEFENDQVSVSKVKMMPKEEIGLHRDAYPQIVIALKGGTITRLEANGKKIDVQFPTGVAVVRGIDPPNELHKSINKGTEPVELIIIQLKEKKLEPQHSPS